MLGHLIISQRHTYGMGGEVYMLVRKPTILQDLTGLVIIENSGHDNYN